jgi:Uma2 family endonuclease
MDVGSIVVPEAKPAFEWVRGRALQKVSPSRRHGKLQLAFGRVLTNWAQDRGEVASEWRFYVAPPGEAPRPLVPDVAYLSGAKFDALPDASREYPPLAPDIVVEILSPDDRAVDVDHKREVYLAAGTLLVLIVDPLEQTMRVFERGAAPRFLGATGFFQSTAFPDLSIDLAPIFATLDRPSSP